MRTHVNKQQKFYEKPKLIISGVVFIIIFIYWMTCFKMISPGYVGVLVNLFGDNKGTQEKELHVGMHWISPWKRIYIFPIFEQNDTWEGNDDFNFQTSEGLACAAEVGITYHLQSESIPRIFSKYRRGMYEITHVFIRNYIRDAINKCASRMKIEDLYGPGKEAFFEEVQRLVSSDLKPIGIELSRIYLIGRFHFPQNVIRALNSKIEATQRAQQRENELREATAEAEKLIAKAKGDSECLKIRAESEANANKILSESLKEQVLLKQFIEKWDGKLPMYIGTGTPIINLPQEKPQSKKVLV